MKDDGTKDYFYIKHILECIEKIQKWHMQGKEEFLRNEMLHDAIIRNLQILGESTKRLSVKAKEAHPEVPWKDIFGFRNIVVHEYLELDVEIIWELIKNDLPILKTAMQKLLKEFNYDQ